MSTSYPAGKLYWLILELDKPYQGLKFQRKGLQVRTSDNAMYILDRKKKTP